MSLPVEVNQGFKEELVLVQVNKIKNQNQSKWRTVLYKDEIDACWEQSGHEADEKEPVLHWRSWEVKK